MTTMKTIPPTRMARLANGKWKNTTAAIKATAIAASARMSKPYQDGRV